MHAEILFKVGDSNPAHHSPVTNWSDGHPIAAMPRGLRVEPADYNEWFSNGVNPPGFSSLPKLKRRLYHFHMRRRRAYLRPGMTAGEKIDAIRKIHTWEGVNWATFLQAQADGYNANAKEGRTDWTQTDIRDVYVAEMDARIADHQTTLDRIMAMGWDSNWGFKDLAVHAVVHADLTWHQYENITTTPTDHTADVFRPRRKWARRAHKVAYQTLLSGQTLANVLDPSVYVPCDRTVTLFTPGQLTDEQQEPV